MRHFLFFGSLAILLRTITLGQNLPNQNLSITNSSNGRVSFTLSDGKRQWTETLDPYFTRQYSTTQSYQITLSTTNKAVLRYNLSPPNKYVIQWDHQRKQWAVITSGRFY